MLPDRPRDLIALGVLVLSLVAVIAAVRRPLRPPRVAPPVPFEVPEQLPPADLDRPSRRRAPARAVPAPPAVPYWIDRPSGLSLWDSEPGTGTEVLTGRVAVVDYAIWLDDASLASATFEHPHPVRFVVGLGGVMPGIDEAVRQMRPGGRRQLLLPPELGYGARGRGAIPPDATVRVDLFLRDVLVPRTEPPSGLDWQEVTPGLQRAVLAAGDGHPARIGDRARMDYAMWVEGQAEPIDQSYDRIEPFEVRLNERQLLPGWARGTEGVAVGSHFALRLEPFLAFGPEGRPPLVPPGATIVLEVSLLEAR